MNQNIEEDKIRNRTFEIRNKKLNQFKTVARLTKNQKAAQSKIEANKAYSLQDASTLVKDITTTKFDASVDIDVRLGVDPRKANQMVRGIATLPHGTGKTVRVLVLCTPDKEQEAKDAGADFVGLDDYIAKIEGGGAGGGGGGAGPGGGAE